MKNWSIRKQIVVLALLPALFVGLGLAIYFTYSQIEYISNALRKHGESIATQIAPASEYAVFSGNTKFLEPTLRNALNDQDVVAITIKDKYNNTLVSFNDEPIRSHSHSFWRKFIETSQLNFRVPIISQEIAIEDFTEYQLLTSGDEYPSLDTIGYVELTVTTYYSDTQKISSLNKAVMLTMVIMIAGFILAVRVSKQIAIPVMLLTNTVQKIASGDFKTRVTQDAPGELGILESYVNSMASELQSYHEDMESRIDDFTRELQQTLEELELRNAELDITRSNALAASRAKSEFLANMSHEIRTPLCGIMGFSELLDNTQLAEQQKDYVTTIRKSAGSLLSIIDDILDLSKIESGKLEITLVHFNLLDIIEEVIDLLSPAAYEKNIELIYNLRKETPRFIEADPVRIRQVLLNLLGNAIKFTEKGYVHLEVEPAPENKHDGLRFIVTDTGIGMSKASKKTLFHAFTQADTSITRRFGGTGLGLVISRKLTTLMNGSIDFDSVENQGSRFWFRIPVKFRNDDMKSFNNELDGIRVALTANNELCHSAIASMLEYWACEIIDHKINENNDESLGSEIVDINVTCLSLADLAAIKPGAPGSLNKISKIPQLAIISSNAQEDAQLVRAAGAHQVLFFSSPQLHIYKTIHKLVSSPHNAHTQTPTTIKDEPFNWSGIHVLIVDDNAINLRLAEIILRQHGAEAITASSGEVAIEAVKNNNFDIIFMDLHMPGLDGYDTTKRIRQLETATAPIIIALTANAMPAERARTHESGMNDIMIKPISEQIMANVISKWLNRTADTLSDDRQYDNTAVIFSLDEAEKFTAGNVTLAIELTNMLKLELPEYQHKITIALKSRNHAELKTQVHKLHGASRCCGTPALREAAEYLERVLDAQQFDEIKTAVDRLEHEIVRLLNFEISAK